MKEQSVTSTAISVNKLTFSYPNSQHETVAIDQFVVGKGEKVLIKGPSGSGKTTFLNMLVGILLPTSGDLEVAGQPLLSLTSRQRDRFRAKHTGVIFQSFNLLLYLSVIENIQLAQQFAGENRDSTRIAQLIKSLGLPKDYGNKKVSQLSIGQQQRVAIARALVNQPEVLIADEPSSALDEDTRNQFLQLLVDQCNQNDTALVVVSHDRSIETWFDRIIDFSKLNTVGENQ